MDHAVELTAGLRAAVDGATSADRLGVRRQTVQARLRRVTELLDLDPDRQSDATSLELAITARRVRRAGGA